MRVVGDAVQKVAEMAAQIARLAKPKNAPAIDFSCTRRQIHRLILNWRCSRQFKRLIEDCAHSGIFLPEKHCL